MKVVDIKGVPYLMNETFLMEKDEAEGNDWRAVLRSELKDGRKRVQPYYFSQVYNRYKSLSAQPWKVKFTFFGRLHIGCRTFDRKNTKIILGWARGAQ